MSIVLKSGSLNLLEISGPVQACNGTALPLPLLIKKGKIGKIHPIKGQEGPKGEYSYSATLLLKFISVKATKAKKNKQV